MVETATRLPLSLDEIFTIARGKPTDCSVELAEQRIIELSGPGAEPAAGRQGYLLAAAFRFRIEGEPYQVLKPYVLGYDDELQEVAVASRKIANGRLRRDYGRLRDAGIEIVPNYFEELRAPVK